MDNTISPVNFRGLWAPVKVFEATNGYRPRTRDYTHYKLYDLVYHPFKSETAEEIAKATKKFIKGRTYTAVDIQEGQQIGDYYQINRVRIGEVIDEKDIQEYLDKGFTRKMRGGMPSDKVFWDAMSNDSFGAMGLGKLDVEWMNSIIARIFSKIAN